MTKEKRAKLFVDWFIKHRRFPKNEADLVDLLVRYETDLRDLLVNTLVNYEKQIAGE